jgi:hypothetical protein
MLKIINVQKSGINATKLNLKYCPLTTVCCCFFQSAGLGSCAALFGGSGRHFAIITPGKLATESVLVEKTSLFYSVSDLDPDPDSVRSVDPYPDSLSASESRRAKMTYKSIKNLEICVLNCWMFSVRAEGFFCNVTRKSSMEA